MSNVQCTLYNVHCTMYTVQCTLYNVHCTMYTVQCTMYTVQCTLYNVHCTMYIVQWILYNGYCTMDIVLGGFHATLIFLLYFLKRIIYQKPKSLVVWGLHEKSPLRHKTPKNMGFFCFTIARPH